MSVKADSQQAEMRNRLRPFAVCLTVLALLWVAEWGLYALSPVLQHMGFAAMYSPMAPAHDRFGDFTNFLQRVAEFGKPGMITRSDLGLPFPYPLPSIFIYLPFVKWTSHPVREYVIAAVLAFLLVALTFSRMLWHRHRSLGVQALFWGTFLLLHPMWFLIDRGNIDVFLWFLTAVGLLLFVRGEHTNAALLFGLVGSMKIYPALLLLLFKRGKYHAAAVGVVCLIALTVLTYQLAGPSIPQAMRDMRASAKFLNATQVAIVNEHILRWDHSAFSVLKQVFFASRHASSGVDENSLTFVRWTRPYGVAAGLTFFVLFFWKIRHLPMLNQTIALLLSAIALPFVSYDYTLVYAWLAFAMLLLFACEPVRSSYPLDGRIGVFTGLLFAVTFSPLTNLACRHFGGQIKGLCLLALFAIILRYPMPSLLFGDSRKARPS